MPKVELKTAQNDASVLEFLVSVENEKRQSDAHELLALFNHVTGLQPKMWGSSIVGYGRYQ